MGLLGRLAAAIRSPAPPRGPGLGRAGRTLQGRYDIVQRRPELRRHFLGADGLSPDAALTPSVRKRLRELCRYEVANNSWAKGIVDTLANDVVGVGPQLKVFLDGLDGQEDEARRQRTAVVAEAVETRFMAWAEAIDLADKLRLMRKARAETGEAFGLLVTNDRVDDAVKLDLRLVEADRCTSLEWNPIAGVADGIEFDQAGNPVRYWLLDAHPGSSDPRAWKATPYRAEDVVHYFRADRPEQSRGLPDIVPALELFAILREYDLAVLHAAQLAASLSALIKSEPNPDGQVEGEPFDEIEIPRGAMTFLPSGHEAQQLKAEQPTTTHEAFVRQTVAQIGRCLNMTSNVALGDSSRHNYSSGRLDHQTYGRAIEIDRRGLERTVLKKVFVAWLREAARITGHLPQEMRSVSAERTVHGWIWPAREHVDPSKEAAATSERLANGTTTLAIEAAKSGHDWRDLLRQQADEMRERARLGLPQPGAAPAASTPRPSDEEASANQENARP